MVRIIRFLSLLLVFNIQSNTILIVFGTRPELIKIIPLYQELKKNKIETLLCSTGQHKELLEELFTLFNISPDIDLSIMKNNQDLFYITNSVIEKTKEVYQRIKPSVVIVQGDTTSAMAAALSAFYLKIPIMHVEAGLRTHSIYEPFPEEVNRKIISSVATLHFAPTPLAAENLLSEHIKQGNIFIAGNTIVDMLNYVIEQIKNEKQIVNKYIKNLINGLKKNNKKIILMTVHRKESLNFLEEIFEAVKEILLKYNNVYIIYPSHPNPGIQQKIINSGLYNYDNILVTKNLNYIDMIYAINESDLIITDSGGLQEECVSLNKKAIVLRNCTERAEGILSGNLILTGTKKETILEAFNKIINENNKPEKTNIYGDGLASEKIVKIIKNYFNTI